MARIPDEVLKRLKEEVDLGELVVRSGVALKRAGRDLVGCCPFHDDDTPSLVVSPAKGLWHCMGACQAGGSAIDWVMRTQGVSFRHAVELLRAGEVPAVGAGKVVRSSTVRRLPPPVTAESADAEVLAQVVAYYHATLKESPEALAYLARRKIDDPGAIEHFRLGYADRTLGLRLPDKRRKAGAEMRGRLWRLGVFRASGHEHLTGSLVVPVIGADGIVTELYGRKIRDDLRPGTPLHLYLPGPHRGVWNEAGLSGGEVILCESLLDALSFYCAGFQNVTASYGTVGFTDDHAAAFERQRVARVLLAYDHDDAGDTAAEALAAELMDLGIECFRVTCPHGADVNDVAMTAASAREALGRLVRQAAWMGKGAGPRTRHHAHTASSAAEPEPIVAASPVSPLPPPPRPPAIVISHDELVMDMGQRRWRVRNIPKAATATSLRVNVMVNAGERFHVDVLDLYVSRARAGFADAAASELRAEKEAVTAELGQVLLAIEEAQAAAESSEELAGPPMSAEDKERALSLLESADLIDQVADAFSTLGVVGERTACLTAWLTLTSRLSERPLGAVIQSSSAAGKSTLADAALALVPEEAKVSYSAMTGQALYYLKETDLAHRVLAIAEEEGAARATYALKLLVSEGRLAIAAAGKDPTSGRLVTHTYEVAGPVALLLTTTAAALDDELENRLLVLSVDEGRAQTRAVQVAQRSAETLEGLVSRARRDVLMATHHAAQRLLVPLPVVNPHAPKLRFADRSTRHRRDNAKLLGLVRAVTLAHQHRRPRRQVEVAGRIVTYIEATDTDVALAEALAAEVLDAGCDELAPATRRLLEATRAFVAERGAKSFTRRRLREATGLGDTQLKVHLARLVDLEFVAVERAGPATTYELLDHHYGIDRPEQAGDRSGLETDRSGIGRGPLPHRSANGRATAPGDGEPFAQQDDKFLEEPRDRSASGQLRVVGEGGRVEHVRA